MDEMSHALPRKRLSTSLITFLKPKTWSPLREPVIVQMCKMLEHFSYKTRPFLKCGVLPLPSPPKEVLIPHFILQPLC